MEFFRWEGLDPFRYEYSQNRAKQKGARGNPTVTSKSGMGQAAFLT